MAKVKYLFGKVFFLLLLSMNGKAQFYSGSQLEFGKSRIQYHPFDWSFYRYERFDVYFYAGSKEVAIELARAAEAYLQQYEQRFSYPLEGRLQIVVFNRLSDLKQTNLGTGVLGSQSLGGTTMHEGGKMLLYMEDGYAQLYTQLREGIATAFVSELLLGTEFREKIRSAAFLHLSEWYFNGLISWLASEWTSTDEDILRDGMRSGRFKYPDRLTGKEAAVAGSSVWKYIAKTFGESVILDMLDVAYMSRNIDDSFIYVLGHKQSEILEGWRKYFNSYFTIDNTIKTNNDSIVFYRKIKKNSVVTSTRISNDKKHIAWVENCYGKQVIYIYDVQERKIVKTIKTGKKIPDITDLSYPLIAWHPDNEWLLFSDENKGRILLRYYHLPSGRKEQKYLEFFTKLCSIDISPDGRKILMTAIKNGYKDLFIFNNVSNTIEQLSNDGFDESEARWFPDGNSFVFSSNRTNDSLFTKSKPNFSSLNNNHDLFLYHPVSATKSCLRLSNSPQIDELYPVPVSNKSLTFLSDENGVKNIFLGQVDSAITHVDTLVHYRYLLRKYPLTNYNNSVLVNDVHSSGMAVEIFRNIGRINLRYLNIDLQKTNSILSHAMWGQHIMQSSDSVVGKTVPKPELQKDKPKRIVVLGKDNSTDSNNILLPASSDTFKIPTQRIYFTTWYLEKFSARIDRAYLNQSYQPFTGQAGYVNPPLNGMFRFGIADLFEDYRIIAGVRLSGDFSGNEYLLAFQNQKRRLDKLYSVHRQSLRLDNSADEKIVTHTISSIFGWPFSPLSKVSFGAAYRNDQHIYLSSDLASLKQKTTFTHWLQPKLEYVFDNTFPYGKNMLSGTRAKLTSEFFFSYGSDKPMVGVLGVDLRHYIPIVRETIFALRFAAAGSFGPGKLLFMLGCVDNWFNPDIEPGVSADAKNTYVFQTIATNMRGYRQQVRSGNCFALFNAELRWNPVRFFSHYPLKNELINSLQLVPFFDVGSAFTGPHPWSDKNVFNHTIIQNGPITVTLKNLYNPLVFGTGIGLRARIFGYFVRFDYARGIYDQHLLAPVMYLSFCNDF